MRAWLAILVVLLPGTAVAEDAAGAAWAALARGGVALIRHAATSGGTGDPPQFTLGDCATQRNLTAQGRRQAARLGVALRERGIAVARVLSSPWCRCRETAQLLDIGPVEEHVSLSNLVGRYEARDEQMIALRSLVAAWRGPGALVMVSHGSVILPLAGVSPREGEIVVVEPQADSPHGLRVVGRIAP